MSETVIFKNALLIDGSGTEPTPETTLVVSGAFIQAVGHQDRQLSAAKGRVIDLDGKTLMPGLIDAHVHPGNVEWFLSRTAQLPPAVFVHRVTRTLETDLKLGFTSLRDAGGLDRGFREAVEQGLINGPRLLLSVTPITREEPGQTPEPRNSLGITAEACRGLEGMKRAVANTLARGADQIKVFPDGEVVAQSRLDRATPDQVKFDAEELTAAVEAAADGGAYVMAHAYGPAIIQNCIRAGVRSIEHGNLMDAHTAQMMAANAVFYVPTLSAYHLLSGAQNAELDEFTVAKLKIVGEHGMHALEMAHRAGVKIGSGSDIIGPLQYLKGKELTLKAEVMGPMGAIVSATRTNAEMMGLSDQIGTLAPGKRADLIVVDGNPLQDITVFERGLETVWLVMKDGRIVKWRHS